MAGKVKFRKCPECGNKMVLKKSQKYKSKFWACSGFPDCDKTFEYHGPGAAAGLDLNIREIENGYIITTLEKYPDENSDDEPRDIYCADVNQLRDQLGDIFDEQVALLIKKIESCDQFDLEPDPVIKKKRATTAKRGETDVKALIAKMNKTKERVEAGQ